MTEGVRLSIVVPLYRDAKNLTPLFARLQEVISDLERETELILVDDGSADGTAAHAVEIARSFPYATTVVSLARNFGQHAAVFAGLQHARGGVVVTMDSDLQYPPEEIPRCLPSSPPTFPWCPASAKTVRIRGLGGSSHDFSAHG